MAQAITVNREVSVTSGNGGTYGHNVPRSASSASSRPQSSLGGLRPRAKSASNLLSRPDQRVRFRDDTDTLIQQRFGSQDELTELIDFLRNQTPPSDNFMSIPDGAEGEDRGRWSMLRRLGKRRGISKTPQQIRLPDSAVSGITIGGHRHIAISIPLAASPFGQSPRSQYPVYQYRNFKPITAQYAPTRAVLNDKGVVTVLQGITEGRELSSSSPANFPPYQLPSTGQGSRGASGSSTPNSPEGNVKGNSQGRVSDYFGLMPGPLKTPPRGDIKRIDNPTKEPQKDGPAGAKAPIPLTHRASFPVRGSSLITSRIVEETSIDAVMSQESTSQEDRAAPPAKSQAISQDESCNQSLSKSIITTSDNDPVVADAREVKTSKSTPILVAEPLITKSKKKEENVEVTVITQSPLTSTKTPHSPAPSVSSMQNRREKVREKKRRDMEAVRRASLNRQSQPFHTDDKKTMPSPPARSELRPKSVEAEKPRLQRKKSPRGIRICPIMVVTDVRPSPIAEEPPLEELARDTSEPLKPITNDGTSSRTSTPGPVIYLNSSSNPTPPQSAHGSPAHKQNSQDRTSLSRRREWNATRRQEREAREQERKAHEAKEAVRAKARQMVPNEELDGSKAPPMEQEVLRRYEAYREYRIREMERRVRRLERNGDVWLRALVPVLDNLNRTLANVQQEHPKRAQGWISDDDTSGPFDSRGRSMGCRKQQNARDRVVRRSATSERQFLEQLARKREELEAGSGSDDMSGLDTIEPLMRELAGRSRLSFEARRSLGLDENGGMVGTV
ncbi:Fc.00g041210.m01.CDS01 [Cosmosporella sp. VM-42]